MSEKITDLSYCDTVCTFRGQTGCARVELEATGDALEKIGPQIPVMTGFLGPLVTTAELAMPIIVGQQREAVACANSVSNGGPMLPVRG
jgi:hypothetical protein